MKKIAVALAAFAAVAGAQADTITQTESFGLAVTNWTNNLSSSQFDSMLGTLNSVKLTFSYDITQRLRAENLGATADNLSPIAQAEFLFRKLAAVIDSEVINGSAGSFNASAFDGTQDFAGTSGVDFGNVTATGGYTVTLTGAALTDFIGLGTLGSVGYNVRALGQGSIDSDNGNLFSSVSTQARYNLELVYDYTPNAVPEPGSLALVGLALAGAGLVRRKSKQA